MTYTEAKAHGCARRACWGNRTLRVRQTPVGTIEARDERGPSRDMTLGGSDFAAQDWEPWDAIAKAEVDK